MSPGLVSYEFEPVNCTVAKSYYNGSVPCHVTNILHRGCTSQMNCLEIIVETSPNYGECKYTSDQIQCGRSSIGLHRNLHVKDIRVDFPNHNKV